MMARQQKPEVVEVSVAEAPKKSLFDRVAGYLDAHDWTYDSYPENTYFRTTCRLKEVNVRVVLDVYEAEDWNRVLAYCTYPVFVPEQKRAAVVEAITRINYSIIYGNLEMDFKDGEIRVRTVVEAECALSDGMIERVLNANLNASDRYFAPIMAVAFGSANPDTVVELASRTTEATLQ
jgi:hypothetical protein